VEHQDQTGLAEVMVLQELQAVMAQVVAQAAQEPVDTALHGKVLGTFLILTEFMM
jgi:hypothetical protein